MHSYLESVWEKGIGIMGKYTAVILSVFLVSSCAAPPIADMTSGQKTNQITVRKPGQVLIDASARLKELVGNSDRDRLCGFAPRLLSAPPTLTEPLRVIPTATGYGGGSAASVAEPFTMDVMSLAAAIWAHQDRSSVQPFADLLLVWARNNNLTGLEGDVYNRPYFTNKVVLPLIVSYSLLRSEMRVQDRSVIEGWLKRVVSTLNIEPGYAGENNHRFLRDSVHMAFGALTGDAQAFQIGIDGYALALRQARSDGGLPHELRRGFRAIFYQRHAIASLVTIAELAAHQGYDLYGLSINGVDLHKIISFMLNAISNPQIVFADASYNYAIPSTTNYRNQDMSFLSRRGHGRHYMAWILPYIARFPNHENSQKLKNLILQGERGAPMIDEPSGGNMSCLVGVKP